MDRAEASSIHGENIDSNGARVGISLDAFLIYAPFVLAATLTFASSPDDVFITLRYAHNLLAGYGPVYNVGERVNGATSPAGLMLAVVALIIPGGYALLKVKLLSLLFGFLTLRLAKKLLGSLDLPPYAHRVGLFLTGASFVLAYSAANGLETTIAAFAVTGLVLHLRNGRAFARPAAAVGFGALAILARPEAVLIVTFLIATAICIERVRSLWSRLKWATGAILTEVAVVGFNYFYYRSILPNTYYAKRMAIGPALRSGFKYVITTMGPNYSTSIGIGRRFDQLLLAGTDVLIVVGFVVAVTQRKRLGYVAAAVAAQVIFVLTSGGDWMMGGRFLAPVLPQLIVLEVVGALAIWTWAKRNVRTDVVVVAIFGGMVLAATYSYVTPGSRDPVWNMRHGINNRALIAVGGYGDGGRVWAAMPNLIACARPGQLVATSEAGYGPFSALGVRFLDLRGLTNREIAMSAPASMKAPTGVTDINWQQSTSPVGAVIVRSMPVLIVTLDARPEPIVLNGHYKLLGTESFGLTRMKVYERAGVHCPPLVRS